MDVKNVPCCDKISKVVDARHGHLTQIDQDDTWRHLLGVQCYTMDHEVGYSR